MPPNWKRGGSAVKIQLSVRRMTFRLLNGLQSGTSDVGSGCGICAAQEAGSDWRLEESVTRFHD